MNFVSPKLSYDRLQTSPPRYYAGFNEQFVQSAISELRIKSTDLVLDTWNGSGTTTTVCSKLNIPSVGIDINPLMTHFAGARVASASELNEILDIIERESAFSDHKKIAAPYLHASELYRKVEKDVFRDGWKSIAINILALTVRSCYSAPQKNPTWVKSGLVDELTISGEEFRSKAIAAIRNLSFLPVLLPAQSTKIKPILLCGDWLTIELPSTHYDHIITSPPYLTRIDYAQSMLPELKFLTQIENFDIYSLRRNMLGSVLTTGRLERNLQLFPSVSNVISNVKNHRSKASSTYYYRFYKEYFENLTASLGRIARVLKPNGTLTIVTQGSWYKDIFVDLPQLTVDISEHFGMNLVSTRRFPPRNHMAHVNSRSYASKQSAPDECVSVFKRNP